MNTAQQNFFLSTFTAASVPSLFVGPTGKHCDGISCAWWLQPVWRMLEYYYLLNCCSKNCRFSFLFALWSTRFDSRRKQGFIFLRSNYRILSLPSLKKSWRLNIFLNKLFCWQSSSFVGAENNNIYTPIKSLKKCPKRIPLLFIFKV